jgi:glycosyltransferase involved in cell wall biosynthesis
VDAIDNAPVERVARAQKRKPAGLTRPDGRPTLSIVIPVYNERESLELLVAELRSVLDGLERPWEIVFVDDGSSDGSDAELAALARDDERIVNVRLRRNSGKAAALAAGFGRATGRLVITMDADLQDDPRSIPELLAKLDEGYDLVSGWKVRRRDPWSRRMLSRIFNGVTGRLTGVSLHDMNCGIKAYRAEVVRDLTLYGDHHRFIPVLAHQRGFKIGELPVNHRPRANGRSRYGLERLFRGFYDLLTVLFLGRFRHRPLHLFGGVGMIMTFAGFAICTYLTGVWLSGSGIGERPLLTLGVLLIVVGVQFLFMGFLGELMTSLMAERRQRESGGHGREP